MIWLLYNFYRQVTKITGENVFGQIYFSAYNTLKALFYSQAKQTACLFTSQHVHRMFWLKNLPTLHLKKSFISLRFFGRYSRTLFFSIFQIFSIGFMSGAVFCRFITLMLLSSNHARVTLAMCFGPKSCWKI